MSLKINIILFSTAIVFAVLIGEYNIHYIRKINPENLTNNTRSLVYDATIYSIDNEFYTVQIEHMINGDGYTLDPFNPEMKVRRTPIYPLFFGVNYLIFGPKYSYSVIKWLQVVLFAFSAVLLSSTVINLFGRKEYGIVTGFAYALSPFIGSYTYFTITEGLTPFLVVLSLHVFSLNFKQSRNIKITLILSGATIGLAFLNRPVGGVLLPSLILYQFLLQTNFLRKHLIYAFKCSIMIVSGFALIISPWIIRNYLVTNGDIIVAEKYYYEDPMDFGRSHIYFRNWISCWTNPANFSAERLSSSLIENIQSGNRNENERLIDEYIDSLPKNAFEVNSSAQLKSSITELESCFNYMHGLGFNNGTLSKKEVFQLKCQEEVKASFKEMIQDYKSHNPIDYYLITPLKNLKQIVFQSNSSNLSFLNPQKLEIHQTIIKTVFYILNVSLFLSVFVYLLIGDPNFKVSLGFALLFTFVALSVFLFRYIESRYFLPIYPLLYISFGITISEVKKLLKSIASYIQNR